MRHSTNTLAFAVSAGFTAGILLSPLADHAVPDAHAQTAAPAPALTAQMIDLASIKHGDLPTTSRSSTEPGCPGTGCRS